MPAVMKEKLSMDSNGKKDSGREVYAQERIQVTEKACQGIFTWRQSYFL